MAEQLGFIGVGRMGGPMAGRLIDAGHRLTIHDTSAAALRRSSNAAQRRRARRARSPTASRPCW